MERLYEGHRKAIDALSCFYQQNGIRMMLLKGYGLSLYWPKPNHRPVGNMDIFLSGCWQQADRLVSERLGIKVDDGHEHHTCFTFQGVSVENHYDFVNTKVNDSARELEALFKRIATFDKPLKMEKGVIYLPSPTLNAIFLIRHLGQHFVGAEATLRQILDWGFFMQHEHGNVDWELVASIMLQNKAVLCEQMEARDGVSRRDMKPIVAWQHCSPSKVQNDNGLKLWSLELVRQKIRII